MFRNQCCGRPMMGMQQPMMPMNGNGCGCPIVEPTITKCVEKEFFHEVPHVCPIHTHVINRHVYKHTYSPQFTCSEENQVVNLDCCKCSQFMQ